MSNYAPFVPNLNTDVDNPVFDLMVKDEALATRAENTFYSMLYMSSQLNSLDETGPAYERLTNAMGIGMSGMAGHVQQAYNTALVQIHDLNEQGIFASKDMRFTLGLTLVGGAGVSAAGLAASAVTGDPAPFALAAVAAQSNTALLLGGDTATELRKINLLIDEYMELADRVDSSREAFDSERSLLIQEGLIVDEDADQLVDEDADEV